MLISGKTAVVAALVGGFALTGVGVAQAQGEPAAKRCYKNDYVSVCAPDLARSYATTGRKVVSEVRATCSSGVRTTAKVKATTSGSHRTTVHQKVTAKCSTRTSR